MAPPSWADLQCIRWIWLAETLQNKLSRRPLQEMPVFRQWQHPRQRNCEVGDPVNRRLQMHMIRGQDDEVAVARTNKTEAKDTDELSQNKILQSA